MSQIHNILRIDASPRETESISRRLSDDIVAHLSTQSPITLVTRNISEGLPVVDQDWVNATFTPKAERSDRQKRVLGLSDTLVSEIKAADTLVIGTPMYNFGIPASLKSWIDQICRVGELFKYTDTGPVGLTAGKRAIIAIATGGVPIGSPTDFASGHLTQLMNFIGIKDVTVIAADGINANKTASLETAKATIKTLKAA